MILNALRRLKTTALLMWIGTWGLLVAAVCPAPFSHTFTGVLGWANGTPDATGRLKDAGFKWVRITVLGWADLETGENVYDPAAWKTLDDAVRDAFLQGFSIDLMFGQDKTGGTVPPWANGGVGGSTPPDSAHSQSFRAFMSTVAQHHMYQDNKLIGERVAAFEMWGEPNLNKYWNGSADGWQDLILAPGYDGIQDAKANGGISPAYVVAPSTFATTSSTGLNTFLYNSVSGALPRQVDIPSIHAYGSQSEQKAELDLANTWCDAHLFCSLRIPAIVITVIAPS